jgi:hypothetical protein
MTLALTRMFAYFTLIAYLVVGSVAVRFMTADTSTISISTNYLNVLTPSTVKDSQLASIEAPEQKFAEIAFPAEIMKSELVKVAQVQPVKKTTQKVLSKNELPFHEPVQLFKVEFKASLPTGLLALFVPIKEEVETMVAEASAEIADEVSTTMAMTEAVEAEPVFFEYSNETSEPSLVENRSTEAKEKNIQASVVSVDKAVDNSPEEVALDDLLVFDYSAAKKDIATQEASKVSKLTTQKKKSSLAKKGTAMSPLTNDEKEEETAVNGFLASGYPSEMTIQASGTNLKNTHKLNNFEIRFQDDLSEMMEDFGNGVVTLKQLLAEEAMTRSVAILKRGYAPTNTELILEKGVGSYSLPMIEEDVFNEKMAPFESLGAVGALLIELDDETEIAQIDVPFGDVIKLDGELKKTTSDNYRYQLFLGVKAGNALVTYKRFDGESISKVLHIHDRELTFEANFFEKINNKTVALYEEGLLGKEKSPLIIPAENVKIFASNKASKKINDHTHKVDFDHGILASRRYIELSHQDEPIFVGIRNNTKSVVPSENFMRYVLSRLEGARLGNRCLVQVNLSKKAVSVDVGSESVGNSLMTYTQVLDTDGKFYDSVGVKTRKIIIVGENQGSLDFSQDAKINIKITYQDDSVQYLGSYCSPNSYLVEQL